MYNYFFIWFGMLYVGCATITINQTATVDYQRLIVYTKLTDVSSTDTLASMMGLCHDVTVVVIYWYRVSSKYGTTIHRQIVLVSFISLYVTKVVIS